MQMARALMPCGGKAAPHEPRIKTAKIACQEAYRYLKIAAGEAKTRNAHQQRRNNRARLSRASEKICEREKILKKRGNVPWPVPSAEMSAKSYVIFHLER